MRPIRKLSEVEQITLDTYQRSAAQWSSARSDLDFWAEELNVVLDAIPSGRVLDAGCGAGRDARMLAARGYEVYGIDLCGEQIRLAAEICPSARFEVGSMHDLPFADAMFDCVWSAASLLHIPKDDAPGAISEIRRVLRRSGMLTVILKQGVGERLQVDELGPRYFAYYEPTELRNLLESGGLKVDRIESSDKPGGPWVVAYAFNC